MSEVRPTLFLLLPKRTLLMAAVGHTFALSSAPIWVQPFVAALSLDRRPFLEGP